MEERIQALALRLEEIDALLASPEIAADAEKMRDLLRERKHLEPITTLYAEYKRLHDYFGKGENNVMKVLKEISVG